MATPFALRIAERAASKPDLGAAAQPPPMHGPAVVKDGDRWVLWYFSEGLRTAGAIFRATNP